MLDEFKGLISPLENEKTCRLQSALVYDSIFLIANTLKKLNDNVLRLTSASVNCNTTQVNSRAFGSLFMRELKKSYFSGATGPFYINERGQRETFRLRVISLNKNGLENVGMWDTRRGLSIETFVGFQKSFTHETSSSNTSNHLMVAVVLVRHFVKVFFAFKLNRSSSVFVIIILKITMVKAM